MDTETELLREEAVRLKTEAPISVTELFTIGIGPSSSHTVGPMRAAYRFAERLGPERQPQVTHVVIELFGSLALTGKGHATDPAVMLGLLGWQPETVDPDRVTALLEDVRQSRTLMLAGHCPIPFAESEHLLFRMGEFLPGHPNAVRFSAFFADTPPFVQQDLFHRRRRHRAGRRASPDARPGSNLRQPYPFSSADGAARDRPADQALDRGDCPRQRTGLAGRDRDDRLPRPGACSDARLHRPGLPARRNAAGRPQGPAPGEGAVRRSRSPPAPRQSLRTSSSGSASTRSP